MYEEIVAKCGEVEFDQVSAEMTYRMFMNRERNDVSNNEHFQLKKSYSSNCYSMAAISKIVKSLY